MRLEDGGRRAPHDARNGDGDAAKRTKDEQFRREALALLPDVSRFALYLARDESDADDLVQETYLRAYASWHTYDPGSGCRSWLFTICRNTYYRTRRVEQRLPVVDEPGLESIAAARLHVSADQEGLGDLFARVDLADALARALDELPAPFKEAVVLVDVQDQSYETAAEVIGVPIGTIRSRLYRARRMLQEALLAHARDAGLATPRLTPPPARPPRRDPPHDTPRSPEAR